MLTNSLVRSPQDFRHECSRNIDVFKEISQPNHYQHAILFSSKAEPVSNIIHSVGKKITKHPIKQNFQELSNENIFSQNPF